MPQEDRYRAHVGERAFDVLLRDGQVLVDGEPVACTLVPLGGGRYTLLAEGRSVPVVIEPTGPGRHRVTLDGREVEVAVKDARALLLERFGLAEADGAATREVRAPMPGLVLRVAVEAGQAVAEGDGLLVLEAMKMENELRATAPGTVKALHVAPGEAVSKNALLIEFE